jgi:hypothetical protein
MIGLIRKRLTYANVAMTLAVVFAMTGGAFAAKHYVITSTKQIKPSVLKALHGETGAAGAQGPAGPAGPQGPQGKDGAAGKEGEEGVDGERRLPMDSQWDAAERSYGDRRVERVSSARLIPGWRA